MGNLYFPLAALLAGSQLPSQGLNLSPWRWKCGVLTTGPPGSPSTPYFCKPKTAQNNKVYSFLCVQGGVGEFWEVALKRMSCSVEEGDRKEEQEGLGNRLDFPEFLKDAPAHSKPRSASFLDLAWILLSQRSCKKQGKKQEKRT